jgi:phosphoribosylaminoimidazole-succinocarboxamide synthase
MPVEPRCAELTTRVRTGVAEDRRMAAADNVMLWSHLDGLELVARGKVRDIYAVGEALLIVTTDRLSAFDVVLPQGVPDKGRVLTEVSAFWFRKLADICPHHMISVDVDDMPAVVREHAEVLRGRAMLVRRCKPFPVCAAPRAPPPERATPSFFTGRGGVRRRP